MEHNPNQPTDLIFDVYASATPYCLIYAASERGWHWLRETHSHCS